MTAPNTFAFAFLRERGEARISRRMKRIFDMDDRARLPWRFYGAMKSALARLS